MFQSNWQPSLPIEIVIFDCDGTLSQIEGIDFLVNAKGADPNIQLLTERAMSVTGMTPELYQKRMASVRPSRLELEQLGLEYYKQVTPGVEAIVQLLQAMGKTVYIFSAGLYVSVVRFAEQLSIPRACVFAVDVKFDESGEYVGYDDASPLVHQQGKRQLIDQLNTASSRIAFIGDGMNDVQVATVVNRLIGYGGAFFRESIAKVSDFYIKTKTMAPLLPLILTPQEADSLSGESARLYAEGVSAVEAGQVLFPHHLSSI